MNERNRILFTDRGRRAPRTKIILFFFLLLIICAYTCAAPSTEASSLNDHLKPPPTFIPEFMAEKENAAALYADGIYAVYAADRAHTPDKTLSVTASQVNSANWSLGMEARHSPILEEHGNPQRHESLGGIVKGTLHF